MLYFLRRMNCISTVLDLISSLLLKRCQLVTRTDFSLLPLPLTSLKKRPYLLCIYISTVLENGQFVLDQERTTYEALEGFLGIQGYWKKKLKGLRDIL